jgi:cytidyltransferase-like protein
MKSLPNLYDDNNSVSLGDIECNLNNYLLVSEKLDGIKVYMQRKDFDILLYKRDSRFPISKIDRTLISIYENLYEYVKGIDVEKLPENWRFCFEYFFSNHTNEIKYDRIPKNGLVLTNILVKNNSYKTVKGINDPVIIEKWSKILEVESSPVIFKGFLKHSQKEIFMNLVNEKSSYIDFMNLLNPSLESTFLNESKGKEIDSFVFQFYNLGKEELSFQIKDCIIEKVNNTTDIYSIIILDVLEFIEHNGLFVDDFLKGDKEQRYLNLISNIFNAYYNLNKDKFNNIDFQNPEFIEKNNFDLNTKFIENKKTLKIIESNKNASELFKMMLSSFRKKRDKETNIFTKQVVSDFNSIVSRIQEIIDLERPEYPTFNDYLKVKNLSNLQFTLVEDDVEDDVEDKLENKPKEKKVEEFFQLGDTFVVKIDETFTNINKTHSHLIKGECVKITSIDESTLLIKYSEDYIEVKRDQFNYLFEKLDVTYIERGKEKVNIFVGRFQPFTKGHIKSIQDAFLINDLKTVLVIVRNKNDEKIYFEDSILVKMSENICESFEKIIKDKVIVDQASISKIFNALRPKYEPVLWIMGSDRLKTYMYQINKIEYRNELNVLPEFKQFEIKRTSDDISSSKVREFLKIEDIKSFKESVPVCIHDMYEELKNNLKDE